MPELIPKPCRSPGCPGLTTDRYCLKHLNQRPREKRYRDQRPSAHARGYDRAWNKARRLFLLDNPLCIRCADRHLIVEATVVDHIEPHRGDRMKFWDRENWQALCKRCHDKKTAGEDRMSVRKSAS